MSLNGNTDETNGYNSVIKNGEDNDANMVKSVIPPIGSILAWYKTLTGTPSLPDGWVECDGSVLSDSDSPYDGETMPDLNSTPRFLRGAATSGGTGGSDTHTLTVDEMPAHTHDIDVEDTGIGTKTTAQNASGGGTNSTESTGGGSAHNNMPAYLDVVFIIRVK